jgi:mono/diheme cytochrome c family protein
MIVGLSGCDVQPAGGDDARANAKDPGLVKAGESIYAQHCSTCHGARLEGQSDWRRRLPNGRMPAPPHDESGHTWHHPDAVLFSITKHGLVPPNAPKDYESDMPTFEGKLTDAQIWAALAYIKGHWTSREVLETRAEMTRNTKR